MFDRLIDLLLQSARWFIPFCVVDEYKRGLILRFGIFHRELAPGFHWMIPCGVERYLADNVVPRTVKLLPQSLHTKDGKAVTVAAVVTSEIRHIRKAMLDCETVDNVIEDSCYGTIGALVAASDWADVRGEQFTDALTAACRKGAFRYGVEITRVQLSDIALCRSLRLYQSQPPHGNPNG